MTKWSKSAAGNVPTVKEVSKVVAENLARPNDPVAVAAYFRAEKRHFEPGHELEDWFEAEAELTAEEK